jgi:hypothetical protein
LIRQLLKILHLQIFLDKIQNPPMASDTQERSWSFDNLNTFSSIFGLNRAHHHVGFPFELFVSKTKTIGT